MGGGLPKDDLYHCSAALSGSVIGALIYGVILI